MNKQLLTTMMASIVMVGAMAQNTKNLSPRLVVGIVIDQLCSDYLEAFSPLYGDEGFNRLIGGGQVYTNVQYPSANIDRASAIASIQTGTVPYNHGIVGETWMERATLQPKQCVDDKDCKGVNTQTCTSARNLLVSTIGDELKVATKGKGLVYSVAPFREAAVLAAGHAADWAMWIDDENGQWAGTSYYGEAPSWLRYLQSASNINGKINSLTWEPSSDFAGTYNYYLRTNQKPFKHTFKGAGQYRRYKTSALVNEEVTRAAGYCLNSGNAGIDETTDYLSVCYYAGSYGNLSSDQTTTELQDTYLRLDQQIATLLKTIDKLVGMDKTIVYLTSTGYDATPETANLAQYRIPSGKFAINRCAALLNMYLTAMYGSGKYVDTYYGQEIFLNHKFLEQKQLKLAEVLAHCEDFLFQFSGVRDVYTSQRLTQGAWTPGINRIRNAYNPKCSGDITIQVMPGWDLVNEDRDTSRHQRDSFFEFPMILYGASIQAEKISTPVTIDCIAPTIAHYIHIRAPNACTAAPIYR